MLGVEGELIFIEQDLKTVVILCFQMGHNRLSQTGLGLGSTYNIVLLSTG